jgi:hypothetical protein
LSITSKIFPTNQDEDISFVPPTEDNKDGERVDEAEALETDPGESSSVPKYGSFVMDRKSSQKISRSLSSDDRDIDFSPAGSALETASPPVRGSFVEERCASPKRDQSSFYEINVIPDTAGKDMPTSPPPNRGSFIGQSDGESSGPATSPIAPRLSEINFSPGASEMETAAPPLRGSFLEGRNTSPMRGTSHRDINVIPETAGKDMPTSPPPNRGSFIGRSDGESSGPVTSSVAPKLPYIIPQTEDREINFSPGASEMETAAPPLRGSFLEGRNTSPMRGASRHDINVTPETAGKDMPTSPPPKQGSFLGQNDTEKQSNRTMGVEETKNGEEEDSDDDDDPMQDDQSLWRSKKLWEAARMKQKSKSMLEAEDELPRLHESQHAGGQVIIPGEMADSKDKSDQLANSINKLGALLGSAHNNGDMAPLDNKEENEALSTSILKIGELLGSIHNDKSAEQIKALAGESETAENHLEEDPGDMVAIETTDSDLLDDLLGGEEPNVKDEDTSVSESIVELGSLQELSKRSENKVHDDDETVHIGNTTKQRGYEKDTEGTSDDYVPEVSIAKLEALLDEALEAPLEVSDGKSSGGPNNFIEHGNPSPKKNKRNIPKNSPSKTKALDRGQKSIKEMTQNGIEAPYVPSDSIAKIEALLKEALEAPLENDISKGVSDDPTSGLDDFLDKALDDTLEIAFEPMEEETKATIKVDSAAAKPTSKRMPKPISSTSRLTRLTQSTKAKSKHTARASQPTPPVPTSRKPAIPRFRRIKKTSRESIEEDPKLPSKKTAVPQFRGTESVSKKGSAFMLSTFSARKKRATTGTSKSRKDSAAGVTRTKKFVSKLTSWTKRGNETAKEVPQVRQSPVPAPAPEEPLRRDSSTQSIDETTNRLAKPKSILVTPAKQDATFTGMPSVPKHSDFYVLSPMAHSVSSFSSQCSVTGFRSPRREGKRGCQQKFNPYLHNYRGPCELCVFFLSDEDKAKLDAEGRHVRVMFTSGGCCKTCEIFPRSFDEDPARLCRMCYGNSHRKIHDYFSSKRIGKRTLR